MQSVIHPDDCNKVMHQLEKEVLIAGLKKAPSVSLTYRQVLDGRTQYMNLLAFRLKTNTERIVVGVRNIDEQKKQGICY